MLDNRASIHVVWRQSYDKDFWPHMEAAKREMLLKLKFHLVPEQAAGAGIPPLPEHTPSKAGCLMTTKLGV